MSTTLTDTNMNARLLLHGDTNIVLINLTQYSIIFHNTKLNYISPYIAEQSLPKTLNIIGRICNVTTFYYKIYNS